MFIGSLYSTASIAMLALLTNGFAFGQEQPNGISGKAEVVQSDKKKIVDQLQGKWTVVELQIATKGERGERFVCDKADDLKMVFEFNGDEWSITQDDEKPEEPLEFSIDVSKSPMWIDMESTKGIFRFEGNTLIICYGEDRPVGFDVVAGQEAERYVLKRIMPKDGDQRKDETRPISRPKVLQDLQGTWTLIGLLDGKASTEKDDVHGLTLKINGDSAIWRADGIRVEVGIKVDDSKTPMWIEFSDSRPFFKPCNFGVELPPVLPMKGVFRIEGDKLTICVSVGGERPTGFDAIPNQIPPIAFKKSISANIGEQARHCSVLRLIAFLRWIDARNLSFSITP